MYLTYEGKVVSSYVESKSLEYILVTSFAIKPKVQESLIIWWILTINPPPPLGNLNNINLNKKLSFISKAVDKSISSIGYILICLTEMGGVTNYKKRLKPIEVNYNKARLQYEKAQKNNRRFEGAVIFL